MAGKRTRRDSSVRGGGGGGGGSRSSSSSAQVFRKSSKKQRLEKGGGGGVEEKEERPSKPPRPTPPTKRRPKDQPKPRTKHEFIKLKQEEARKEKQRLSQGSSKVGGQRNGKGRLEEGEKRKKKERRDQNEGTTKTKATVPSLLIRPPVPTRDFRIVAGSYERFLYGLTAKVTRVASSSSSTLKVELEPYFTFPAHVSSIRSVACAGPTSKWLATGGTDEVVKVWDIKRRKEVGALTGHEGTITSLSFASKAYLITTSADSNINLYRTRDWALLRTLKGHLGRINSASVHPTGRLALSVGSDRTIRMWDLMRGRPAASTRIGTEADSVRWDTQGKRLIVLSNNQAMIFSIDMTKISELEEKKRIGDVRFQRFNVGGGDQKEEHELLLVANEEGIVRIFDLDLQKHNDREDGEGKGKGKKEDGDEEEEEGEEEELKPLVEIGRLVGHKNRVKSVACSEILLAKGKEETGNTTLLATTISSDGLIRVFDLSPIVGRDLGKTKGEVEVVEVQSLAEYDTNMSRLTCLDVVGISEEEDGGHDGVGEEEELIGSDGEEEEEEEDEEGIEIDTEEEEEELERLQETIRKAKEQGLVLEDDDSDQEEDDDDEEAFGNDDDQSLDGDEEEEEEEEEDDE
ncbi:WD40 repeat-like protein [Violaceomyces palustris]|uniref:WD40 repeat-like protein n=1 Tax=Violaceomyces palustris TaxID=1673888 RepID=A0ACD0P0V5_9BASI|nr:WD40 repeat-like protein [Violaceomyces palustris]